MATDAIAEITKVIRANTESGRFRVQEVFQDFVELAAIALRNDADPVGWAARERRYMETVGQYTPESAMRFAEALGGLALEMSREPRDILGELYMSLEAGNKDIGQFFTPYSISQIMASLTMGGAQELLKDREFITIYEPCSGGGAMLVAAVQELKRQGADINTQVHITAEDLSANAVYMTYVQLSLLGAPAIVQRVNTLSREEFGDPWPTAAHLLGGWSEKLNAIK